MNSNKTLGALGSISSAYGEISDSEEEYLTPEAEILSVSDFLTTDFGLIKDDAKEKPPREENSANQTQFQGKSYASVQIKEEEVSDDDDSDSVSSLSSNSWDSNDHSESDDAEDEGETETCETTKAKDKSQHKARKEVRVKGELLLSDLPPIEDLHITMPHEKCIAIGVVKSVVDPLVIVEAYPKTAALNLDTVLFLEQGDRTLGQIFDVIGPVQQPYYCIRFNSKEHIEKNGIQPGMLVYCAPQSQHTNYVFLAQLQQMKGTDASWEDDIEPPPEANEFSDDEAERAAKNKGKRKNRNRATANNGGPSQNLQQEQNFQLPNSPYVPAVNVPGFSRYNQQQQQFVLQSQPRPYVFRGRGRGRGNPSGNIYHQHQQQQLQQHNWQQYQHNFQNQQAYNFQQYSFQYPYQSYSNFYPPPPPPPPPV